MSTLIEALDTFLKVDRSPMTTRNYRRILGKLLTANPIDAQMDIQAITLAHLVDYTNRLTDSLKPSSLRQYVLVIKTFFAWCAQNDYLVKSPAANLKVRTPQRDPNINRAIPSDHVDLMCRVAYANPRDYALLHFLKETGARAGGTTGLQVAHLDLDEGHAVMLEKGRKYVDVYFWGEAIVALRRWLQVRPQVDHDYVFTKNGKHGPLTVTGLSEIVRRISIRACGVEYGPHSFRHYVAQVWEAAGASPYDIQHKLNHVDVRTTQGSYLQNKNPRIQAMTRQFAERLGNTNHVQKPLASNILYLDECG